MGVPDIAVVGGEVIQGGNVGVADEGTIGAASNSSNDTAEVESGVERNTIDWPVGKPNNRAGGHSGLMGSSEMNEAREM